MVAGFFPSCSYPPNWFDGLGYSSREKCTPLGQEIKTLINQLFPFDLNRCEILWMYKDWKCSVCGLLSSEDQGPFVPVVVSIGASNQASQEHVRKKLSQASLQ